ncbi:MULTISPECIES: outer membrane protein assembly factor BamA [unclassified Oceanobacter]|uniref:outer membrane protein assembly factor BamA n=1 Tax=unclassified Oceanobacter TaxID=2620260 RepID=UPI0027362619|nr:MULTISPECIES: outer membrane protein assembly factor BamA [unclassified Oceanobacter]MDP2504887.1 outer membrane protein assembly factor BamA [Oceanobacter sp. 3_MG-2023]MDP2607632.1 outer membrane protein assembly factor BamA [Oceanobacter sp. 1_MG-2023]MDP2610900.1 outer membrane protein assembly factor BamA [Oceanobacter sp. 2_MG-2023]
MRSLLFSLFVGLFSSFAYADDSFVIEDIRLEGLQRVSAGTVFERLPINAGDQVDSNRLAEVSRRLFATGFFNDIRVYRDNQVLIFQLVELPTITQIELDGNSAIPDEILLDNLKLAGLAEGMVFKRSTLERIALELERQYVMQGRYDAHIETVVEALPRNRVALKINVEEGNVASIAHINIVGNESFPDEELLKRFSLQESNFWSWYAGDNKYSREKLAADQETLRSYYYDRGYLRFNIESTQVALAPEKDGVYITVNVTEGEVYTIRDIRLAGNLVLDEEEFTRFYNIAPGDVFSRSKVLASSEGMIRRLGNDGYTFAKVDGSPKPDDETLEVDLTFFVEPGRRTYVRSVNFSGNDSTMDEVLRREMLQMEGGWASTEKIEAGKNRLNQLGFFKTVTVETPAVPGTDDLIDVEYNVEEQMNGSLNFNIGYAGGSGMILGASISQNNFMGSGNRMSLGLQKTNTVKSYNFSFSDPYYTIDGVSRGFNLYYRETDYDSLSSVSDYQTNSRGGSVTFGYPISRRQRLSMSAGYNNTEMFEGSTVPAEILEFLEVKGDNFDEYTLGLNWRYNGLNRGMFPTAGIEQKLSLDVGVPGSDLTTYKLGYTANYYFPLFEDWSFRIRTELGYANGYGDEDSLPFYKNFRSGGLGSVRGYSSNSLGPRGLPEYTAVPVVQTDSDDNVLYELDELGQPVVDSSAPTVVYKTDDDGAAVAVSNSSQYKPIYETDSDGSVVTAPAYSESPSSLGGNMLAEASLELIFPFPFVEDRSSLRSVLFLDSGNTFTDNCYVPNDADIPTLTTHPYCTEGFSFSDFRMSTGVGLTWVTAIGPLTFVYSIPLNDQDGDDTEGFEFSLGQVF